MYEPLLTSESNKAAYFFKWIMGILMFGAGGFIMYTACSDVYPQLIPLLTGIFLCAIGFILIYTGDKIDKLEIYKDRVEIKTISGKLKQIIYKNELTAWTETTHSSKGRSWQVLTLYAGEKKFRFSSNVYKNYEAVKEQLVHGIDRNSELELALKKKGLKRGALLFLCFGTILLVLFFYKYSNKNRIVSAADVTQLQQVITSPVEIHKGSKGARSIRLGLKDYPDFTFEIGSNTYRATAAEDFVANVKTGDTILVDIMTSEYQKKLTREKELGFFDKTVGYRTIEIYGLYDKKYEYLTLAGYNENNRSGDFVCWFLGTLGVLGFVMAFVFLKKSAG